MIVWQRFGSSAEEGLTISKYNGACTRGEGLIIDSLGAHEAFEQPVENTFDIIPRDVFRV